MATNNVMRIAFVVLVVFAVLTFEDNRACSLYRIRTVQTKKNPTALLPRLYRHHESRNSFHLFQASSSYSFILIHYRNSKIGIHLEHRFDVECTFMAP